MTADRRPDTASVEERPRFHVLRQYGVLADGERGAVIGPDGALVWMCFPTWHDDALFATLVGGRGFYQVAPIEPFVWGGHYEPASLIWRSRWITDEGIVECRDALAAPALRRRAVVLRHVVVREGRAHVRADLRVRAGYGRHPSRNLRRDDQGRWCGESQGLHFRWSGAEDAIVVDDGGCRLELALTAGAAHDLVLEVERAALPRNVPDPDDLWQETERHWRSSVPALEAVGPRRDAEHAHAVLTGLTASTGGMVAAATTSLPERADTGRSYDYRYVWLRDQAYAGRAVAAVGRSPLLDPLVDFATARVLEDRDHLAPAYTVDGDPLPRERHLDLPGYPGGGDLVGNHAGNQFQLDVFGELLCLLAEADKLGRLSIDGWRAAEVLTDAIASRRDQPDAGVWELEARRWTHSRLACVAGLRAISRARGAPRARIAGWEALADGILADAARTSVHPTGRWQRAPDDPTVDAALLMAAVRRAVPPDDPRSIATHQAVQAELAQEGYVYRFRHGAHPLEQAEGAFLLCGFWMVLSCLAQGRRAEARFWFERNRAACGPPGLLSEEYDVEERQLRGNLPQAFVHALLLECAIAM